MTPQELAKRQERAENEPLVISKVEEGFRVYSPTGRSRPYIVSGSAEAPVCTCPDFQNHRQDPEWRCKHILAVFNRPENGGGAATPGDPEEAEERTAIQDDGNQQWGKRAHDADGGAVQMVLKRSVSPDGRIDSLSVEFSYPVEGRSAQAIGSGAASILKLQDEIVRRFLAKGAQNWGQPTGQAAASDASVPAQLLSVGGMDGKWGRRLFLSIQANGRTLRLFGTRKQLAEHLTVAGYPKVANEIEEGLQLNLTCRVVTKPGKDARYLDVEKLLPVEPSSLFGKRAGP